MKYFFFLLSMVLLLNCTRQTNEVDELSYSLGNVGAFSEMINAGVKKLALSEPMTKSQMDKFMPFAEEVASRHNVSIYRESDLLVTSLFPQDVASGKEVLLLFQNTTKNEYLKLKDKQKRLLAEGNYDREEDIAISREFGRMLSYSPKKINALLSTNSDFRTMTDFGIMANNLFLYYKDLEAASQFYTQIMGLEKVAIYDNAHILRMSSDSYLTLVDESKGMHNAKEPKSVALALLTDNLQEWYDHFVSNKVPIKYTLKEKKGSAHDGFVAIDPEGYLLEIERFNPHPENESFTPLLDINKQIDFSKGAESKAPGKLQFHSTITWLYHKDVLGMEHFYQDVLGLEPIADQGWAKIYQVSETGFMGIVDERRGMNKYADEKAVNIGFILDDLEAWFNYCHKFQPFSTQDSTLSTEKDSKYKAFIGIGPEKYFYEFDKFYPHPDNKNLLTKLEAPNTIIQSEE